MAARRKSTRAEGAGTVRGRAASSVRDAADALTTYPVAAVAGGIVVGALLAWLLPAARRERELLSGAGRRLNDAARAAAQDGIERVRAQASDIRGTAARKVGEALVDSVAGNRN